MGLVRGRRNYTILRSGSSLAEHVLSLFFLHTRVGQETGKRRHTVRVISAYRGQYAVICIIAMSDTTVQGMLD